jgi:hypothetical protein
MIPKNAKTKLAFLLLCCLGAGCQPQDQRVTFSIIGRLDENVLRKFEKQADDIESIEITSQGGDIESSINIGLLIKQHNITVNVKKYCLSACAQYILPAAKEIIVQDSSIIAFHNSAFIMQKLLLSSVISSDAEKYNRLVDIENSFYKSVGISGDQGDLWLRSAKPVCVVPSGKDNDLALVATKYQFVVPSLHSFRKWYGRPISGFWITDQNDLEAAVRNSISPNVKASFVLEGEMLIDIPNLPICDREIHNL